MSYESLAEKNKPVEIDRIAFHGDVIECVQHNGKVWVSLRRACESFGIDFSGQFSKLKLRRWSSIELISIVAPDGSTRETTMIDRKTFLMWLATIDTKRVKPEIAPKIELYQDEVADVIDAHFSKSRVEVAPLIPNSMEANLQILRMMTAQYEEYIRQQNQIATIATTVNTVENKVAEVSAKVDEIEQRGIEATRNLLSLPEPSVPTPKRNYRSLVVEAVKYYGMANHAKLKSDSLFGSTPDHATNWVKLYTEFRYRVKIDLVTRAKNKTEQTGKRVGPLDIAEELDLMEELYAVAIDLFDIPTSIKN